MDDSTPFARKTLTVIGLMVAVLGPLALLLYAFPVLFLVLAGVLIAIFLRGLSSRLSARTRMSEGWALVLVLVVLAGLIAGVSWWAGPAIAEQAQQLSRELPGAVASLRQQVAATSWGHELLGRLPDADTLSDGILGNQGSWLHRSLGVLSGVLGFVANLYVVLFIGLFITAQPGPYRAGLVLLVPRAGRARAGQVLDLLNEALFRWLGGKLFSMAVVGLLTALGLWALGVPLPMALALLAALFSFVPNFGPVLAMAPAALVALSNGPDQALYVVGLYVAVQAVESNLITPLVQKRLLSIPPALTLITQVVLGVFTGGLGLVLATPLLVILMVLTKTLYIHDVLGDPVPEQEMSGD
ncbi:hypothetical protein PK28_17635 (plasmid) [Hymenobacter sp. DG25B]|uniref:AI-2E family transporter n=1 Tax=Hymenobacter sp. DG25B TaxID=1385664 RepID=UPI00054093BA|nr:AI-2E family transporter [Hymenobacter sp. DG25B]AIZ65474.1 hypothetical protein PK28_17635 [Hymenobacter sp. DG25B]